MSRSMRIGAAIAFSSLVLGSLLVTPPAIAEEKVRIGVVLPLSGQFALGGQNVKRGYDLAAEEINKAGGIKALGGAPIELVYADNQGKQEVAIGETERLIQDEKVAAIMGSWHSATTIAGTQAAERLKNALGHRGIFGQRDSRTRLQIHHSRERQGQLVRRGAGRFPGLCQEQARSKS